MATCDMCGQIDTQLRALVEGVEMSVCRDCAKFGNVLQRPHTKGKAPVQQKSKQPEIVERVIETVGTLIKTKREHMGLTQDELALRLAEKSSLLNKIEAGKVLPTLDVARKLEKFFDIVLIEKVQEDAGPVKRSSQGQFTIGDVLKQKLQLR